MVPGSKYKGKTSPHFIFRGKSRSNIRSLKRVSIEAVLMLLGGLNIMLFVYKQPNTVNYDTHLKMIWIELLQSSSQLIKLITEIGSAVILIFLLLCSILLVIGGLLRTSRVIYLLKSKIKPNRDKKI